MHIKISNRLDNIIISLLILVMISGCAGNSNDKSADNSTMITAMTQAARKRVPDLILRADWCDTNENRCEITDAALSPLGDLVAISTISTYDASQGPKIIIWNIKNNKIEKVLEQLNIIYYSLEWSSDGRFLYAGGGCSSSPGGINEYACEYEENSSYETFTIWDSETWTRYYGMRPDDFLDKNGNEIYFIHSINKLKLSPNGRYLAIQMIHSILVFDIGSQTPISHIVHTERDDASILLMNWSPNSQYILSGDTGGDILFWDAKTGNKLVELNESYGLGFAIWSPDSKQLASGSLSLGAETDFHCWNMDTGALNWNLVYVSPTDASWSPNGNLVAIGQNSSRILVADSTTGNTVLQQDLADQTSDDTYVLWSPDGTRLAAYGDHFGKVWDTNNWELLQDNDVVYENLRGIEWAPSSDLYLTWSAYGSSEDNFQLPHVDIWNGN